MAGSAGAAGAGAGDDFVTGVTVTVHPQTSTILVVTWTQALVAEDVWLEFTFAGGGVMPSRRAAGAAGAHRDVVLGVPSTTAVTIRIVSRQAGIDYKTRDHIGMTGSLPTAVPKAGLMAYDAALASPDRWMLGAVENSEGGCSDEACYITGALSFVYIIDRQGRIVWYYADASSNGATGFPRLARDGEYIWFESHGGGATGFTKMTLDRQYMESVSYPGLADAIDVTTDGGVLYDASYELREMNRAGTVRTIWSCQTAFGVDFNCYSNTINWDPASDTVLLSFPHENTVAQIDRQTGMLVATYGDRAGSYTFSPTSWSFEFQHFPNITADGTLLVSTHLSAFPYGSMAGPNQHAFVELTIDRTNRRLVEKWSYTGAYWPMWRGMAIRLPNGNTLVNYGTGGIVQEITPHKQIAFQVKFDVATGDDFFNKMVSHNVLVDDLYALNGGGPQ